MSEMTIESLHTEAQQLVTKVERFIRQTTIAASITVAMITIGLRAGEHYAGVVLNEDGTVKHHTVLMAEKPDKDLTWKEALAWAISVGGVLPDRQEGALIFANCRAFVDARWHWLSEIYEPNASYACFCFFDYGGQSCGSKSSAGASRAVRRVIP